MHDESRLPPTLRGLLQPEAYPHPVDSVELHETHGSWVFLAGPYAYKLKKPVDLGFVARFHASAPTGPGVDEFGSLENVEAHCLGNFREIAPYVDVTIPRWELAAIQEYAERMLRDRRALFEERVAEGRIRDGHGDL